MEQWKLVILESNIAYICSHVFIKNDQLILYCDKLNKKIKTNVL